MSRHTLTIIENIFLTLALIGASGLGLLGVVGLALSLCERGVRAK